MKHPDHEQGAPRLPIELTEPQQNALAGQQGEPLRVLDPRTNTAYVLVSVEEYESVRAILEEEKQQKAIHALALRNAVGRMSEEP